MTTQRENLLDKIRALLSKTVANGCTEEEAFSALAKARAIMDVHEVGDDELSLTREEKAMLRREPPGTEDPHNIRYYLSASIADFCGCKAWRDLDRTLVFCGLQADVEFATWLLDTLTAFVRAETINHLMHTLAEGRQRREVINGFVLGCTDRIAHRLNRLSQQSAPATANAKALIVTKQALVEAKLEECGIKLCRGSTSGGAMDGRSFDAGQAAGGRASFGRPMSGRNATLRISK